MSVKTKRHEKKIYEKSYKQPRRGFALNPEDYRIVINFIGNYSYYVRIVNGVDDKSETQVGEKSAANRAQAQVYIETIEEALTKWVPQQYREVIWERVISRKSWQELSEEYFFSESAIKEKWQMYVWGIATELGWNFKE